MLENEGHWLKLMRNAIVPTDANICLRISGGDILCTVTKDVNKEVELKVTCRIVDQVKSEICEETNSAAINALVEPCGDNSSETKADSKGMLNFASEHTTVLSEEMTSTNQEKQTVDSPFEQNEDDNTCDSGARNEDKRKDEVLKSNMFEENHNNNQKVSVPPERKKTPEENGVYKCPMCSFFNTDRQIFEKHYRSHRDSSFKPAPSLVTNTQSFCDACNIQFMSADTYQVHKKYYCKSRHDKENPPPPSSPTSETSPMAIPGAFKPAADTIILHNGTVNGAVAAPSLIQPQAIYAAISTNPLILLPCSLVSGEGLVAQNGIISPGGPGLLLQTGTSYPAIVGKKPHAVKKEDIAPNRKTSHPIMNFNSGSPEKTLSDAVSLRKRKMSEGDVLNRKNAIIDETVQESTSKDVRPRGNDYDFPLDLSFKKRKTSDIPYSKSITERRNSSEERMDRSPMTSGDSCSSPKSAIIPSTAIIKSTSGSYSNESIHYFPSHGAVSLLKKPQVNLERISPSPVLQGEMPKDKSVLPPGMPPPKLLKQGNNVCEECNIVFYKYDNYLAHKKHYCFFRRRQLSVLAAAAAAAASSTICHDPSSDDNNSNHSEINESSRGCTADESNKPVARKMEPGEHFRLVINKPNHPTFVCDACGVKFSSLDTLNAHQTYYCSKREDSAMSKYVRSRSENSESPRSLEPPFSGPEEWKCNYCETTCSSYETITRHLLTHNELRGFRCLICGYKGNTLRGMRAHACEHLNENTASIEEFLSTTVISENDVLPATRQIDELSEEDSNSYSDTGKTSRRDRSFSERISYKYERQVETELSDSKEVSSGIESPSTNDTHLKEQEPNSRKRVKVETRDGSPETIHRESVNPLAFCDVVIKAENDQMSSGDESQDGRGKPIIKSEPEPESSSDNSSLEITLSESPPVQSISVIRRTTDGNRQESRLQNAQTSDENSKPVTKPTEVKYCKSCDISFYHVSNFIAHKKFYCSHLVSNCVQETETVQ